MDSLCFFSVSSSLSSWPDYSSSGRPSPCQSPSVRILDGRMFCNNSSPIETIPWCPLDVDQTIHWFDRHSRSMCEQNNYPSPREFYWHPRTDELKARLIRSSLTLFLLPLFFGASALRCKAKHRRRIKNEEMDKARELTEIIVRTESIE